MPFAGFGDLPEFFDAPCNNLGEDERLIWHADTFLGHLPSRTRKMPIKPLAGFEWGCEEHASTAGPVPSGLFLRPGSADQWANVAGVLRELYPGWDFDSQAGSE